MIRKLFNSGIRNSTIAIAIVSLLLPSLATAQSPTPARKLFAAKKLPVVMKSAAIGFYSKGCLAGGVALPQYGPTWQAMRPKRNRRWGHPVLVKTIQQVSRDAKKLGWNGLLVGDMSQPRGGPVSGHASHQVGLDVDIWLRQMPGRRFSVAEKNTTSSTVMLKKGSNYVDDRLWTKAHEGLLKTAASNPGVDRLFVHPGIKKKLCDTVKGDRSWLRKVRPYWGHKAHFHMRLKCKPGLGNCKKQASPGRGTGCDKSLEWWFKVAFAPKKKVKKKKVVVKHKKKKKVRRYKIMADLPAQCRVVLNGPNPVSLTSVIYRPGGAINLQNAVATSATAIAAPAAKTPAARAAETMANSARAKITVPTPRPAL